MLLLASLLFANNVYQCVALECKHTDTVPECLSCLVNLFIGSTSAK